MKRQKFRLPVHRTGQKVIPINRDRFWFRQIKFIIFTILF